MHPSKKVVLRDTALAGKRIIIGITGSIAAVETVRLIRELLRHGAEVIPVMTKEAQNLIHPYSIEFAAGIPPITQITGQVEHVLYCGDRESAVDLVLICPATANTISKIATGIDDTTVTTFATTALGTGIPLLICPSMHGTMYDHTIVQENIDKLKEMGVSFIDPSVSEGKAKMPSRLMIAEHTIRTISKHSGNGQTGNGLVGKGLSGKKVLIIGGSTAQPLDAMRVVTNRSSGGTAIALATQAFRDGADVMLWYGHNQTSVPQWIEHVEHFSTVEDLVQLSDRSLSGVDMIILCAAISDYSPDPSVGKIPSGNEEMKVSFHPTPKIIDLIREMAPKAMLVGFKAESGISEEELRSRAEERMKDTGCDLMVANLLEDVGSNETKAFIIDRNGDVEEVTGTREKLAFTLFDVILKDIVKEQFQ